MLMSVNQAVMFVLNAINLRKSTEMISHIEVRVDFNINN